MFDSTACASTCCSPSVVIASADQKQKTKNQEPLAVTTPALKLLGLNAHRSGAGGAGGLTPPQPNYYLQNEKIIKNPPHVSIISTAAIPCSVPVRQLHPFYSHGPFLSSQDDFVWATGPLCVAGPVQAHSPWDRSDPWLVL